MIETKQVINRATTKTVIKEPYQKVFSWDSAILIKRDNFSRIPSLDEMIALVSPVTPEAITDESFEKVNDLVVYFYFQFLEQKDQEAKTHYYKAYIKLMSSVNGLGFNFKNFEISKDVARHAKKEADLLSKEINEISKSDSKYKMKEMSRKYNEFRMKNAPYGCHVSSLLSFFVKAYPVQFY
jgi:hypothetical protein